MALVINDRVRETTTVTGTGSATLLGAVTGYQSFSVIGNGNTTYYTIADQGGPNWEVGLGTWSTGGTLARTTVLASSNSGSLVNFTTGTKDVFVTYPSEEAIYNNGTSIVGPTGSSVAVANGGTGATTLAANGVIYGNGTGAVGVTAVGTTGQVLVGNTGAAPSWATVSSSLVSSFSAGTTGFTPSTATSGAITLGGTLVAANGGTSFSTYTTGDVIYASATNTLSKLGVGTTGQILTVAGGVPTWAAAPPSGATISNDTSTASNLYPLFSNATSGAPTTIYTSNAKYLYKPSTGDLQASQVVASNGLVLNSSTVATSYTIATGNNAMSVGPITVASGQSVTVSSGQRWVVL